MVSKSMSDTALELESVLREQPNGAAWCERSLPGGAPLSMLAFRTSYAAASRRLGASAGLTVTPPAALRDVARPHWALVDYARVLLLTRALAELPAQAHSAFIMAVLEGGEIGEQESLLRTLALVLDCERFESIGLSACRTNAVRVFEAIACENAYPAQHFREPGFNQLVLKAVFLGVSVSRIEGLAARNNAELQRMARGYGSERLAAGRSVPEDIRLILSASSEPLAGDLP